jgi:hypothetical protein
MKSSDNRSRADGRSLGSLIRHLRTNSLNCGENFKGFESVGAGLDGIYAG